MIGPPPPGAGIRPVSSRHRFDEVALDRWLTAHLPDYRGPCAVAQFEGGQSNPTFLLSAASGRLVLRKKPRGELAPSAHAIDREYRVLQAVGAGGVPVPRVRAFCEDGSVVGTAFYVMDYVPGRVAGDPLLPEETPAGRTAVYDSMNEALAALHLLDWRALGLEGFGRPEGYFRRQLERWADRYRRNRVEDSPDMDRLALWLADRLPSDERASIVHGDYRLGNLILDPVRSGVAGVLDWELSTIGHPLADLAFNCMTYHLPAGHPVAPGFVGADLGALGIPSLPDYLGAYSRRTGIDPEPDWTFAMAFSLFRTAAIQVGIHARALQGNAASDTAALFGTSYRMVAAAGCRVVAGG